MHDDPPVADLHLHTTASDGRLTIDRLPDAARAGGVDVVAVTDHDRYHPELDGSVVERDGVTIIHGIELRADAGDRRVDLLGYGVEPHPGLTAEVERLQKNRVERARKIVDYVEETTGVHLDIDIHDGIGRPHIAHAIDTSDAPYDYQGAFDELIGADGPCYVPRDLPSFDHGVAVLKEACAVVGLAHPFRYRDPAGALNLCEHLDAVERYYPYGYDTDVSLVDEAIEKFGLLATGGSDAHDETLGRAGPPEDDFVRFAAEIPGL
ncbi:MULTISPECIES: PHP domain-containing protein [Haloferax]|uniref:PHP domain-containing protein n=2 Tax=Haloferax TaxID=2251 RepID=A0A6G1YZJ7_9EURY|nr:MULTISPECIES: PHP domain-containing protein [Haloferax]KAB1187060.1 PHP domain-containing protein [Haloferax sp. CBA1149]MRW79696.1 PHP domain-containing protein [Haloferax marinisediminis]